LTNRKDKELDGARDIIRSLGEGRDLAVGEHFSPTSLY
jgi:hypothetical protein